MDQSFVIAPPVSGVLGCSYLPFIDLLYVTLVLSEIEIIDGDQKYDFPLWEVHVKKMFIPLPPLQNTYIPYPRTPGALHNS